MMRTRRIFATLLATGLVAGVTAGPVSAEPPKGQGYFKDVQGGGAGESECAGPHSADLPAGQAKKC
jgi:hypothetical protein